MFRTHYYLLLKAITTQNYEQLETLTEEKLTMALAAQIYELSVLKECTFDCNTDLMAILDPHSAKNKEDEKSKSGRVVDDQISIVNHVFVRNCSVVRA